MFALICFLVVLRQVPQDIGAAVSLPDSSQVPLEHLDSALVATVDRGVSIMNVVELAQG